MSVVEYDQLLLAQLCLRYIFKFPPRQNDIDTVYARKRAWERVKRIFNSQRRGPPRDEIQLQDDWQALLLGRRSFFMEMGRQLSLSDLSLHSIANGKGKKDQGYQLSNRKRVSHKTKKLSSIQVPSNGLGGPKRRRVPLKNECLTSASAPVQGVITNLSAASSSIQATVPNTDLGGTREERVPLNTKCSTSASAPVQGVITNLSAASSSIQATVPNTDLGGTREERVPLNTKCSTSASAPVQAGITHLSADSSLIQVTVLDKVPGGPRGERVSPETEKPTSAPGPVQESMSLPSAASSSIQVTATGTVRNCSEPSVKCSDKQKGLMGISATSNLLRFFPIPIQTNKCGKLNEGKNLKDDKENIPTKTVISSPEITSHNDGNPPASIRAPLPSKSLTQPKPRPQMISHPAPVKTDDIQKQMYLIEYKILLAKFEKEKMELRKLDAEVQIKKIQLMREKGQINKHH